MTKRQEIKEALFEQVARIAKATASPKRLELLHLLSQAPQSVEALARETGMSVKLTSAHLKELRMAQLVDGQRQGKQVIYRVAGDDVMRLWVDLRALAQNRLDELQKALSRLAASSGEWRKEDRAQLLRKARDGELVIIDVRPANEFEHDHLPYARSLPLSELNRRLAELPKDKPIVAYCRGGFCLMSGDAVRLLGKNGFDAVVLQESVFEWNSATQATPATPGKKARKSKE